MSTKQAWFVASIMFLICFLRVGGIGSQSETTWLVFDLVMHLIMFSLLSIPISLLGALVFFRKERFRRRIWKLFPFAYFLVSFSIFLLFGMAGGGGPVESN